MTMIRCNTSMALFLSFILFFGGLITCQEAFCGHASDAVSSHISGIWANDGSDKVSRDELRASRNHEVTNTVWNGGKVAIFGAKNEVVSFNLVLEAKDRTARNVSVSLESLSGPGGALLSSKKRGKEELFHFQDHHIETFFVRYLEIKGLGSAGFYDERHIPERFRLPHDENGIRLPGYGWEHRPDANKFYPEIAVPMELHPQFDITKDTNQSVWFDIYIPKTVPDGAYQGQIVVAESGLETRSIPVELRVYDFTLPDIPHTGIMIYFSGSDIADRHTGYPYPIDLGPEEYGEYLKIVDRHFQTARRHKIELIESDYHFDQDRNAIDTPSPAWMNRLNGTLFTPVNGYQGPGMGMGSRVYSIGTYGEWAWKDGTEEDMWRHTDNWVNWFEAYTPNTTFFLYLVDESSDFQRIDLWSQWIRNNPGPGKRMRSFATLDATKVKESFDGCPHLDIMCFTITVGDTPKWESELNSMKQYPRKELWMYNGRRPAHGEMSTHMNGIDPRAQVWAQYKMDIRSIGEKVSIPWWFYWESTYYHDFQASGEHTNVYQSAKTFGIDSHFDAVFGRVGWMYLNGDGVLFYPMVDHRYPNDAYNAQFMVDGRVSAASSGPISSLRLKYLRKGIQDMDYAALAYAINPARVVEIVEAMVPRVLWETGVAYPEDPTWQRMDVGFSTDPEAYERARMAFAAIITGQPVPHLVGLTLEEARIAIETGGFSLAAISRSFSDSVPEGIVMSYSIVGTTVHLVVSRGPFASVFHVSQGGNCGALSPCYGTIQAAFTAAGDGTLIRVEQGTYREVFFWSSTGTVTISGGWNDSFTSQTGTASMYAPRAIGGGTVKVLPKVEIIAP